MIWVLAACAGLTAGNFRDKANTLNCTLLESCVDLFEVDYGTVEACTQAYGDTYALLYRCEQRTCRFDEVDAQTCLDNLAAATCEQFGSGDYNLRCDDVFEDCDEVAFEACIAEG